MSAQTKQIAKAEPEHGGMVSMMERLALNPELPVDKLEKLLDMQIRVRAIEAEQAFNEAMAEVQAKLPTVARLSPNEQTNSRYAKHETIAKAIKPIYTEAGFSITFSQGTPELPDHVRIVGVLRHRAGHKETMYCDVAVDKTGIKGNDNKTLTHAEGSSFTYGRRYLTCLMFDVATGTDNDGNGGGNVAVLTEEQAANIEALITEVKADKTKFLKWAQREQIAEIPADWYETCVRNLEAKRAK